jgi:hypothetical protein
MILMLEKISVKTTSAIFLLCALVLALCACVNPVDIDKFLRDGDVQKLIDKTHIKVHVDDKTGDKLTEHKDRIGNLKNYKYYMIVQEKDDKDTIVVPDVPYPKYVTDYDPDRPGDLNNDLGVITRIKGGSINYLENYHTYTVWSAEPIKKGLLSITYTVDGNTTEVDVKDGVITVNSGVKGTGTLNLSAVIDDNYEVMAVKVDFGVDDEDYDPTDSPWNWTSKSKDIDPDLDWASFKLVPETKAKKVDYVFVKKGGAIIDFKVLKVVVLPYVPPEVTFKIEFTFTDQAHATADKNKTINRGTFNKGNSVKLTLAAPRDGGSWDAGSIKWSIGGIPDTVTLSHINANDELLIINGGDFLPILAANSFDVIVYAALNGVPYSAVVTITVID